MMLPQPIPLSPKAKSYSFSNQRPWILNRMKGQAVPTNADDKTMAIEARRCLFLLLPLPPLKAYSKE
jgi:hypothetical protein